MSIYFQNVIFGFPKLFLYYRVDKLLLEKLAEAYNRVHLNNLMVIEFIIVNK